MALYLMFIKMVWLKWKEDVLYLKDLDFFVEVKDYGLKWIRVWSIDDGWEEKTDKLSEKVRHDIYVDMYETCMWFDKKEFEKRLNELRESNWMEKVVL